jgi:hypothetical protein
MFLITFYVEAGDTLLPGTTFFLEITNWHNYIKKNKLK